MAIAYRSVLGGGGGIEVDSLTITSQPTKTAYLEGETLDITGLAVQAVAGPLSGDVTSDCTYSPTVLTTVGTQTITVSYGGKTTSFTVSVEEITLSITAQPTKTQYAQGNLLDLTGIAISATGGGTSTDVTSECTFSPANGSALNTTGTITVTATLGLKSVSTTVSVYAVSAIAITTPPTKTSYKPNEQLDLTGIVVTATASPITDDVTAVCTFSPADGTTLTTEGTFTLTASFGGFTATTTYKVATLEMVAWSTGTDAQIKAMIDAYYAGDITLNDIKQYWNIGDERTVALSAMAATGVGESHIAQNVTMVIMNWGGKKLASDGTTDVLAVVGQKDLLNDGSNREGGYMNSTATNTGGWKNCARRSWCNDVYRAAITSQTMRDCFKQFINQSGTGGSSSSGVENTSDYFAMAAEIEVFGTIHYSVAGEGTQFKYYETANNRKKYATSGGSASYWWERSPRSGFPNLFCIVNNTGDADNITAEGNFGLAPFGCI